MNRPWLLGVYLAANVVRDVRVLVDGPDCAIFKGQLIFPRHDLLSTLLPEDGPPRMVSTCVKPDDSVRDREAELGSLLRDVASRGRPGAVLLTSLPSCTVTGTDYGRIARDSASREAAPVVHLPGGSLAGDWIDGYDAALAALAASIDLPVARPMASDVAIVGHFMHRNEGDMTGDLGEMRRLVEGIGLRVACSWPSGGALADLAAAAGAGLVVSLPAGREAARVLAGRTGADLLEADLPLGLEGTRRWVEAIGERTGRAGEALAFVDRELSRVVPRVDRLVPFCFMGREALVIGDPAGASGLAGALHDLGCSTGHLVIEGRAGHAASRLARLPTGVRPVFEPVVDDLLGDLVSARAFPDVAILPGEYAPGFGSRMPVVETGFPSCQHHVLDEAPVLGFRGILGLVGRIAGAMMSSRA